MVQIDGYVFGRRTKMSGHLALPHRAPRWFRRVTAHFRAFAAARREAHQSPEDRVVDEVGEDSFPASDPPSWTLGIEHHHPKRAH
jgi:hypothetical protein